MKTNSKLNPAFIIVLLVAIIFIFTLITIQTTIAEDAVTVGSSVKVKININNTPGNYTNQTNPNANYTQVNNTQVNNTNPQQNNANANSNSQINPDTQTTDSDQETNSDIDNNYDSEQDYSAPEDEDSIVSEDADVTDDTATEKIDFFKPFNNFFTGASVAISNFSAPLLLESISVIVLFILLGIFITLVYKRNQKLIK